MMKFAISFQRFFLSPIQISSCNPCSFGILVVCRIC
jgi:hypothetical protein